MNDFVGNILQKRFKA